MNKNIFNVVKVPKVPRSVFDLSHDVKLSCNMGDLIPVYIEDLVPGDKFHLSQQALVRFMPLVSPVMHRFDVTFHSWFVPKRLLWEGWNDYITDTKTAGLLPAPPFISIDGTNETKLSDYMGIPPKATIPGATSHENINAMPFAAYQMIYNEFYRDENLVSPVDFSLVDGANTTNITELLTLRKRAWEHDYFTSALPFVQKGDPVSLPLNFYDVPVRRDDPTDPTGLTTVATTLGSNPLAIANEPPVPEPGGPNIQELYAQTSVLSGTTNVNDLRRANALQRWLEKLARGGSRLSEMIRGVFGVTPKDASLQRPQYIGGSKSPVIISDIEQTSQDIGGTTPQGNLAGKGTSVADGQTSSYFADEHGFIITVLSIMPRSAYQQGIDKMYLKIGSNTEHYFPDFANIGEQPILNKELYAYQGATGEETFGYTPRYSEYKYRSSRVSGQFRTTLDFWHEGRIFASLPLLNQAFIDCIPDTRIFAVTDPNEDHMAVQVYNEVKAVRPMPKFGTPSF